MESEKLNNDETGTTSAGEIPVHFRLMDVFLDQVERSTPFMTSMMEDIQKLYTESVHMALKAGEALENRSEMNLNYFRTARNAFDAVSPAITDAQIAIAKALADSACQGIKLVRKNITGRT
jgi:hypothetical protein